MGENLIIELKYNYFDIIHSVSLKLGLPKQKTDYKSVLVTPKTFLKDWLTWEVAESELLGSHLIRV